MKRVEIKGKVIDLNLVEEADYVDVVFTITLNNGRELNFVAEPIEIKPVITGTMKELDITLSSRLETINMHRADAKELYYVEQLNGNTYALYDKKKKEELYEGSKGELKALYDRFNETWNRYKESSVKKL